MILRRQLVVFQGLIMVQNILEMFEIYAPEILLSIV